MHVNDLLKIAVEGGAWDPHLKVGTSPMMRVRGTLVPALEDKRLEHEEMVSMAAAVLPVGYRGQFKENHEVDLASSLAGLGRFRCNAFQQRGTIGMVFRVIPRNITSVDDLALPPVLKKISREERGLVLVTGATGSGKTTTLAAMIDEINSTRTAHIMTIEDPIEYLHRDKKSVINQREIGPLVFSTPPALDATETINRIIAVFPPHQQKQIRLQLASVLRAVVSQRLMPKPRGEGRVPAAEGLTSTAFIRDCIADREKTHLIHSAIAQGTG